MKNIKKIEETVYPIYEQFTELGNLYEDECLSWEFLKKARRAFANQYFFELKLIFKAERRNYRHESKIAKKKDKERFKRKKIARRIKRRKKAELAAEGQKMPQDASKAAEKSKTRLCKKGLTNQLTPPNGGDSGAA